MTSGTSELCLNCSDGRPEPGRRGLCRRCHDDPAVRARYRKKATDWDALPDPDPHKKPAFCHGCRAKHPHKRGAFKGFCGRCVPQLREYGRLRSAIFAVPPRAFGIRICRVGPWE